MRIVGVVLLLIAAGLVVFLVLWEPAPAPDASPRNFLADRPDDDSNDNGSNGNPGANNNTRNNSSNGANGRANNGGHALNQPANNGNSSSANLDNGAGGANANNADSGNEDTNPGELPSNTKDWRNTKHWRLAGIPEPVPPADEDDEDRPHTFTSEATDSALVLVTAGTFIRGNETERNHHNELPVQRIFLSAYYIDKHPITVAQFREFMRDGGYDEPEYWSRNGWSIRQGYGWTAPRDWDVYPELQGPDQPVVGVSLWEAEAFANWRTVKDGLDGEDKLGYALPTECQWEKAARGTDGRRYPWGDEWNPEACNWADGAVEQRGQVDGYKVTSPVWAYSDYASPYGVCDMAGNTWDWVADHFDDNYYRNAVEKTFALWSNPFCREFGGREFFVQRGGAYDFRPDDGHFETTFRYANLSSVRVLNTGFRLCLPAAAVEPDPNGNGGNGNGSNGNGDEDDDNGNGDGD